MAASKLCSGLEELDRHWTMDDVAAALEVLAVWDDGAAEYNRVYEKLAADKKNESALPVPVREENREQATDAVEKIQKVQHLRGAELMAAVEVLLQDHEAEFPRE